MKIVLKSMPAAVFAVVTSGVFAGTYTFNNPAGGNFSVPGNWEGGVVPTCDGTRHTIRINVNGTGVAVTNDLENLSVGGLSFSNGAGITDTYKVTLRGNTLRDVGSVTGNCSADLYTRIETDNSSFSCNCPEGGNGPKLRFRAPVICTEKTTSISYGTKCASAGSCVIFHSELYAPKAFIDGSGNSAITFYDKVTADRIRGGKYWTGSYVDFVSGSKVYIAQMECGSGTFRLYGENVVKTNAVLTWKGTYGFLDNNIGCTGTYLVEQSQTVDCLDEPRPPVNAAGTTVDPYHVKGTENHSQILTLRPSRNVSCYAKLGTGFGLTLNALSDEYEQEFTNRVHTFNKSITVKKGVLAFRGATKIASATGLTMTGGRFIMDTTESGALAGMTTVSLKNGSVFELGPDTGSNPFGTIATLSVWDSSYLQVANDLTITATKAFCGGVYQTPGTYCAIGKGTDGVTEVPWIRGNGKVTVTTTGPTSWKAAVSGNWNDPANWTAGVPGPDDTVYVMAGGTDYTVTVNAGDVMPDELYIGNNNMNAFTTTLRTVSAAFSNDCIYVRKGGRIEVPEGGNFYYYGLNPSGGRRTSAGVTPNNGTVSFLEGGEMLVSGGTVKFEKYSGYLGVGDIASAASGGAIRVTAGKFSFSRNNVLDRIVVGPGGTIEFSGTAEADFSGNGCVCGPWGTSGTAAGSPHSIVFRDQAKSNCPWIMGHNHVTYDISCNPFKSKPEGLMVADLTTWGYGDSAPYYNSMRYLDNTVNVTNAAFTVGGNAFMIAGACTDGSVYQCEQVRGTVNLKKGASVTVGGGGGLGWLMPGLEVGWGVMGYFTNGTYPQIKGYLNLAEGSAVTNTSGYTYIGVGQGYGEVNVRGGEVVCKATTTTETDTRRCAIAAGGGTAKVEIESGLFKVNTRTYIGGMWTNALPVNAQHNAYRNFGWKPNNTTSHADIIQRGGKVEFGEKVIFSSRGSANLDRYGSTGTFTVTGDLVFSNVVDQATSGTAIKCVLDENGFEPVRVGGKLAIGGSTRLAVDTTAYPTTGKSVWLFRADNGVEGNFSETTLTGPLATKAKLVYNEHGIRLCTPAGTFLVVR